MKNIAVLVGRNLEYSGMALYKLYQRSDVASP